MKRWIAAAFLLAAGITAGLPAEEVVDFTREKLPVVLHRPQEKAQGFAYGRRGLEISWDCAKARHFEFFINRELFLPEFIRAEIRVTAELPPAGGLKSFNLRLADAGGETFQFSRNIPENLSGRQEFVYRVDCGNPAAGSWGGPGDGVLDFPVRLNGFAGDFGKREGAGRIGIERVSIRVLDSNRPLTPELETGNPIHVLTPGDGRTPVLKLVNTRGRTASGRLEYAPGRAAAWRLGPGEEFRLELPRPEKFGVSRVEVRVIDDDPKVRPLERRLSFAYMPPAGPTPGRAEGFLFGVCSHSQGSSDEELEREAMAAAWCGAKVVREDILWERLEPEEGRSDFSSYDRLVAALKKYHLEPQAIYCYVPGWAVAKEWKPVSAARRGKGRPDYGHWANFIRAFAQRYRGEIRYVEVWNEPDLIGFADFSQPEYLELMKIAHRETKAAAPEMNVLTGGYACMPGMHGAMSDAEHMPKTLRGGRGFYDIHAFHGHGPLAHYRPQIERLMKLRRELGVTAPWYANETAESSIHIGERRQARTLVQKLLYSWARGAVGYNWYDLRNDGYDPRNNEHNFGLVTRDFYPKEAYAAYNMLAGVFRGGEYRKDLFLGDGLDCFLFRDGRGNFLLPHWNNRGDSAVRLAVIGGVTGRCEQIDLFGNRRRMAAAGGEAVIEVGEEPATLLIGGQEKEPVPCGELIRREGDANLVPGGSSTVKYRVTNATAKARLFRLDFSAPGGVALKRSGFRFRLAPGGERTVELELRAESTFRSLHGQLKHLNLRFEAGGLWKGELEEPLWTVARLREGDFPQVPDFELKDASRLTMLAPNDPARSHLFWKGPEDLSGKVYLARNRDSLKLRVEVTDDRHCQPFSGEESWKGDSVQLALRIPGQAGSWEIGFFRRGDGGNGCFVWNAPAGFDVRRVTERFRLETGRDEERKRTLYEAVIPFAAVGLTEEAAGRGFRFNLLINDNDGEMRESFIAVAPGLGDSKNTDFFPVVSF